MDVVKNRSGPCSLACGMLLLFSATAGANDGRGAERRQLEGWIANLADRDSDVREAGRIALMGLSPDDLPKLREAAAVRPLRPAEIEGLREAVVYILMHAAVRELPNRGEPFLGVVHGLIDADSEPAEMPMPTGVTVIAIAPGLPAARYLQVGDVILGVDNPMADTAETIWIVRRDDLSSIISRCPPGRSVTLHIRRAGRLRTFTIRPEPRPRPVAAMVIDDTDDLANFLEQAQDNALAEFQKQFGALIGEKL